MVWIDWAILIVLALSVLGGIQQGFLRVVFSLGGLFLGLALGGLGTDGRVAALLIPLVRMEAVADAIGFLAIALVVMAVCGLVART